MAVVGNWGRQGPRGPDRRAQGQVQRALDDAERHLDLRRHVDPQGGAGEGRQGRPARPWPRPCATMDDGPSKFFPGGQIKFDDKGRRVDAGLTIIQWQSGVPVTVYPPERGSVQADLAEEVAFWRSARRGWCRADTCCIHAARSLVRAQTPGDKGRLGTHASPALAGHDIEARVCQRGVIWRNMLEAVGSYGLLQNAPLVCNGRFQGFSRFHSQDSSATIPPPVKMARILTILERGRLPTLGVDAETSPMAVKRQVEQEPAASAPRGRRAASRGLWYLLASQPKRSDVSDRGRRPGGEDRLVFPAAQR